MLCRYQILPPSTKESAGSSIMALMVIHPRWEMLRVRILFASKTWGRCDNAVVRGGKKRLEPETCLSILPHNNQEACLKMFRLKGSRRGSCPGSLESYMEHQKDIRRIRTCSKCRHSPCECRKIKAEADTEKLATDTCVDICSHCGQPKKLTTFTCKAHGEGHTL